MFRRRLLLVAAATILSVSLVACGSGGEEKPTSTGSSPPAAAGAPQAKPGPSPTASPAEEPVPADSGEPQSGIVEILNQDPGGSGEYKFVPSELEFKLGETVTFVISAETEFHTFTVDDLGIDQSVNAGETVTLTYTFDKAGTFKLICIPHESFGMVGEIVVQ